MEYDDNKLLNSKNIPLYFYLPESLKKKISIDINVAGSHKDIFPTLYNLTLKDKEYISIGKNLFDLDENHYGFNGSMIVNKEQEIEKLDKLSTNTDNRILNYYKANLAITEYLIKEFYKEGKLYESKK